MSTSRKPDINLWEVMYRKRLGLGPFYGGGAAAILAAITGLLSEWQTAILMTVLTLALAAFVQTRITDRWRRTYLFALIAIAMGWVMFARLYAAELFSWVALANISGCLLFGIGWWSSHRKRSQIYMEEAVRDFPKLMKRIGYDEIRQGKVTVTPNGFHGRLIWDPGVYDVDDVLNAKKKFDNVLGRQRGQVDMDADGKSTNSVIYRVTTVDPHAAPQSWPLPDQVRRAADPLVIGPRKDGEMLAVRRYDPAHGTRHVLAGGATGSGKSSYTNLHVAEDVCSDDTFTIGIDMKQVELTPWAPALGYCVTKLPTAVKLLRSLVQPDGLFETRGNILARRGARVWNTDIDGPLIDFVIDETKELLGSGDAKTVNAVSVLATKGRAYGIRFYLASQYPTLESIGSSQIRQQIGIRLCFRMEDSDGETFIMPGSRVYAEKIDSERPGTCYVKDGSRLSRMPVRVLYIDDELRDKIVEARAGRTVDLDPESAAAIERHFPEFADRPRPGLVPEQRDSGENDPGTDTGTTTGTAGTTTGTGSGTVGTTTGTVEDAEGYMADEPKWLDLQGGPELDPDELNTARRERLSPEQREREDRVRDEALAEAREAEARRLDEPEARAKMLEMLAEAWPESVSAKALRVATGRSSTWFYEVANKLEEDGALKRDTERYGHWMLPAPPPQLVETE